MAIPNQTVHAPDPAYDAENFTYRACKSCSVKKQCSKATYGKGIHRSEFHEYIQINKEQVELNKALYKRRQAIVEHPYGTIKRPWGFSYIMTKKSQKRASADVGLMMTANNLRRIINILGVERLMKYLEELIALILSNTALLDRIMAHILAFFEKWKNSKADFKLPVYRLSLINISQSIGDF